MDTFNKKSLCVALAATGVLGVAGVAQAVNVSADGLGNVLIYPYYTVNSDANDNTFNTLMSVVNTTASTKAIKVRFREGRNSWEVLDFNVFLSPWDVWTGVITPGPVVNPLAVENGTANPAGAQISTSDKSCTIPTIRPGEHLYGGLGGDQRVADVGSCSSFEMATYRDVSVTAINSKHTSAGVPLDCSKVTDITAGLEAKPPGGGLFGGVTILSPAGGGMFTQPATALANFKTAAGYFDTGSTSPTYGDADPVSNTIFSSKLYQTTWGATPVGGPGFNAVTAVLMANDGDQQYVLDIGPKSQTSWIVTFPTKFNYVTTARGPSRNATCRRSARARTSTVSYSTAKKPRRRPLPARTSRRSPDPPRDRRFVGKRRASVSARTAVAVRRRATSSALPTTPASARRMSTAGRRSASMAS
jgi:hypothetical protein